MTAQDRTAASDPYSRAWWDVRAAWIVLWRVRSSVVMDFQTYRKPRWWQGWGTTVRVWWMQGHGRNLVS